MAWAALIPVAMGVVKTIMDQQAAKSGDAALQQAGADKIRMMREGAGQLSQYRSQLTPQMMQAMQNQMSAYGPAQNVLSQMYGGGAGRPVGPVPPQGPPMQTGMKSDIGNMGGNVGQPSIRSRQFSPIMGGETTLLRAGMPSGSPLGGRLLDPGKAPRIGFGGEVPIPTDLMRRKGL